MARPVMGLDGVKILMMLKTTILKVVVVVVIVVLVQSVERGRDCDCKGTWRRGEGG